MLGKSVMWNVQVECELCCYVSCKFVDNSATGSIHIIANQT